MSTNQELSSAKVIALNAILQKTQSFAVHLDAQLNMLIVVGSAIFIFFITRFYDSSYFTPLYVIIFGIFALLSVLTALLAIFPPRFLRKKGQHESIMYHYKIGRYDNPLLYLSEVKKALATDEDLIQEYTKEIYNISKYYYRPKRVLFEISRNFLFIGFVLSLLAFLSEYIL